MSDIDPNMLQGPDDPQPGHFKPEVEKTLPVEMKLKHFDKLTDFHEQIHLKRYTIPTLRVRDPNEPLSGPEKAVFGELARRHEITGYPIEQGMTDHSPGGGRPGVFDGKAPSDDAQAIRHFGIMIDALHHLCAEHKRETDPLKKNRHRIDHELTADHVATVAQKLIDAGIVNKSALAMIPQL